MEQHLFGYHMETLRRRLYTLQRCVDAVAGVHPSLLEEIQDELAAALEEGCISEFWPSGG